MCLDTPTVAGTAASLLCEMEVVFSGRHILSLKISSNYDTNVTGLTERHRWRWRDLVTRGQRVLDGILFRNVNSA